jgi:adenosylmethionine-8-amino-7-oxononanoate aminotransferase
MLRIFRRGEGAWLYDETDRAHLDLCSSMWQAPLGHGRTDIVAAYADQAAAVASAGPIYFTTEGAAELAWRLARSAPGDLSRVFLTSSGSEATETATKLARQYHRQRGDHHRYKFISRYGSYHGAGMGGTSIGGRRRRDALYYPLMPGTVNIAPPTGRDDIVAAEALRTAIEMEGPETVAAFIGEPVAIMAFTIPDDDYWPRVREICDEYGVLLIADETLTGCYRTGTPWAIERWGVTPDVLVAAKAVSSGYAPVAAMIVREHIYQAFGDGVPSPSVQSYGGHGASAAAGARAFEVYETERMGEVAERRGAELELRLAGLREHPLVRDIRRVGLWLAIELQDPKTGASLARGMHGVWRTAPLLSRLLLAHGMAAARMSEGLLHIAPPYISTDADLDFIADRVAAVVDAAAPEIARL